MDVAIASPSPQVRPQHLRLPALRLEQPGEADDLQSQRQAPLRIGGGIELGDAHGDDLGQAALRQIEARQGLARRPVVGSLLVEPPPDDQRAGPIRERDQIIAEMVHRITDEQIWMGLFFDTEPSLIANRIVNLTGKHDESRHTWNAHLWDIKT